MGLVSAVSSPVGSGAKAQPTKDLVHILSKKRAALVAAIFSGISEEYVYFSAHK